MYFLNRCEHATTPVTNFCKKFTCFFFSFWSLLYKKHNMGAYVCTHTHSCMYVPSSELALYRNSTCIYASTHIHTCICTYVYACIYVYILVAYFPLSLLYCYTYTCICARMHRYIRIHIHSYILKVYIPSVRFSSVRLPFYIETYTCICVYVHTHNAYTHIACMQATGRSLHYSCVFFYCPLSSAGTYICIHVYIHMNIYTVMYT